MAFVPLIGINIPLVCRVSRQVKTLNVERCHRGETILAFAFVQTINAMESMQ
jgi:hypothetical protein